MAVEYDRLSARDAVFLRIETAHEPQHVGSLSVLEGAPLRDASGRIDLDELRAHVEQRLDRVPRMRQKVMEVPFGQARPVWIDDEDFDVDYHVRLTALPRPGDEAQLAALMSRLQSLPLDRRRPLWEMWFVDGLADGRVGLIIKVHHALGDGIANVDLALALVDTEREPADEDAGSTDSAAATWSPRPAPTSNELLADAIWTQVTQPQRVLRRAWRTVRDPGPATQATRDLVSALLTFRLRPEPAPWNVPVSAHRRWVHATVPLETVRKVRADRPVSINDVVLAACTGALRGFLDERHADDRQPRHSAPTLKAMVPVSVRGEDERGDTLGNRVSLIIVDLPIDESDPIERLKRIHTQVGELRRSGLVDGASMILDLADAITPFSAPLTRFVSRSIPMNLVVTNIPGPPVPLFFRGASIERTYPYVEVIDNQGLTIAVVSYEDQLFFGITADLDVMNDLEVVAEQLEKEFVALADATH